MVCPLYCPAQLSCRVAVTVGVFVVWVGVSVGVLLVGVEVVVVELLDGTVFRCTGGYELTLSGTTVMLEIVSGSVLLLPCVK